MYPVLFQFGSFTISSFGFMMVVAFLTANYILKKDVKADGYDSNIAEDITFRAAFGGILGAKLYYILENINTGNAESNIEGFVNIIAGIFTLDLDRLSFGIQNFGAGLVFLGGLIGGTIAVCLYASKMKISLLKVSDWVAPVLILGHGIGRIGCFLVGDDYGIPTDLPWGCSFPNGLPPTNDYVHPTQLYEMLAYFCIFIYLRRIKNNQKFQGEVIFEYLFLGGFSRFLVEFIRTNDKYIFNLSGAQIISIVMMLIGSFYLWRNRSIYYQQNKK